MITLVLATDPDRCRTGPSQGCTGRHRDLVLRGSTESKICPGARGVTFAHQARQGLFGRKWHFWPKCGVGSALLTPEIQPSTSAGGARRLLDIAVEGRGHGHQVGPLVFDHLGHAELIVLGVADLLPQRAAPLAQPGVEFDEGAEALLG